MSKRRRNNYFDDDDSIIVTADKESADEKENSLSEKKGNVIDSIAQTVADLEETRLSSTKKHIISVIALALLTILILVGIVGATAIQMNIATKRNSSFETDAGTACAALQSSYGIAGYESLVESDNINGFRMTGLCYVRRIDFNNDKTNELLACYNHNGVYTCEIWGYTKNNKFKNLYKADAPISDSKNSWITLYSKDDKYYIGEHDKNDITVVYLYGLKGESFVKKYKAAFDTKKKLYSIKGKVDEERFERVKLCVIARDEAMEMSDKATEEIDSLDDSKVKGNSGMGKSINDAYYDIIMDYNSRYGYASYQEQHGKAYIDGLAVVDLVDFDNDDVKELVLVYRKGYKVRSTTKKGNYIAKLKYQYYMEIFKYNGTSAVRVYESDKLSTKKDNSKDLYYLIKKDNNRNYLCTNYFSSSNYDNKTVGSSSIMKLSKNTFKPTFKARYVTEYGYTNYYIDGDEVYSSSFRNRAYKVPFFDGSEKYDSDKYRVVYVQRKKIKSDEVKSQVAKTEATIKQLNQAYVPGE